MADKKFTQFSIFTASDFLARGTSVMAVATGENASGDIENIQFSLADLGGYLGDGYVDGGNTYGANATIGLNDAYRLGIKTNNLERLSIFSGGNVAIGSTTDAGYKLDVHGTIAARGSAGLAMWVGDNLAIRGLASSNGVLYFDASQNLTGTITIRASKQFTFNNTGLSSTTSVLDFKDIKAGSASDGTGYQLNSNRVLSVNGSNDLLRFNDNSQLTKVGIRGENICINDNGNSPVTWTLDDNAVLDVTSTTRYFLLPRMTTTQRNAISTVAEGAEIYNLTTHKKQVYDGTTWQDCF